MKTSDFYQMLYNLINGDLRLPKKAVQVLQQTLDNRFANNEVDDTIQMNNVSLYSFKKKVYAIVDGYLDIPLDEIVGKNNQEVYQKLYNILSNQ